MICECCHFHPRELVAALKEIKAKHYIITHLNDKLIQNFVEAQEYFTSLRENAELTFAEDGLVLEI